MSNVIRYAILLAVWSLVDVSQSQDLLLTEDPYETRIVGGLSDSGLVMPSVSKEAPEFQVQYAKEVVDEGRLVRMCRVIPLVPNTESFSSPTLASSVLEEVPLLVDDGEGREVRGPSEFFVVSATVYDHRWTLVRWWVQGAQESCEAWSNIDFNLLEGFHEFEEQGRRYLFVMSVGNVSTKRQQAGEVFPNTIDLPALAERGPRYALTSEKGRSVEALATMDALHALYAVEEQRLKEAYVLREERLRTQKEELESEVSRSWDTVIHYWPQQSRWHGKQEEGGASK